MSQLIDGLLKVSRLGQVEPAAAAAAVDTEAAIEEAIGNLHVALVECGGEACKIRLAARRRRSDRSEPDAPEPDRQCATVSRSGPAPARGGLGGARGRAWIFSVADNGLGIDPAFHARIFDLFERLHGAEIRGAGIGLATCKRIVERYGGRIWVESRQGEGATFRFSLPAAAEYSSGGKGAGG